MDIFDKPLVTAKKWLEWLEDNDKDGVQTVIVNLMQMSAVALSKTMITRQQFDEFIENWNNLEGFNTQIDDVDEKWSMKTGINLLKNAMKDVILLVKIKQTKFIVSFLIHVGIILWMQQGYTIKQIPSAFRKMSSKQETEESNEDVEEAVGDSINDDLPYFGGGRRSRRDDDDEDDDSYPRSRSGHSSTRRRLVRSEEYNEDNGDEEETSSRQQPSFKQLARKIVEVVAHGLSQIKDIDDVDQAKFMVIQMVMIANKSIGLDYLNGYDSFAKYIKDKMNR